MAVFDVPFVSKFLLSKKTVVFWDVIIPLPGTSLQAIANKIYTLSLSGVSGTSRGINH
ncbi:hypothetical protein SAMN05660816_03424 [Niastella yeongjuensis]|nr:hypothetical protein SAMN05660816_03424 [Niastella yeongjuensis]